MEQNITYMGKLVTGIILVILSLFCFPLSIGLLLSYPNPIYALGILLLLATLLLIISGIYQIVQVKRGKERANEFIGQAINAESNLPIQNSPEILAIWQFTKEEWEYFYKIETREIKSESIYFFIAFLILGTFLLYISKGNFMVGAIITAFIGGIISFLKYKFKTMTIQVYKFPVNIRIGLDTVLINEKMVAFRDQNKWLDNICQLQIKLFLC